MTDAWRDDDELTGDAPPAPTEAEVLAADVADLGDRIGGVDISNELEAVHNLTVAIKAGAVPELYVKHGVLYVVSEVSGTNTGLISDSPHRDCFKVDTAALRLMCAFHLNTFKMVRRGNGADAIVMPSPALPSPEVCKVVLSQRNWPGVPRLTHILRSPVVRRDGSISQEVGYDAETGTWLNPVATVQRVSEMPSAEEVYEARSFILDVLLRDFPWVGPEDKANELALLFTQVLRPVHGGLVPLGIITAAAQGAGKTALANLVLLTHGGNMRSLPYGDEETRKQITSIFLSGTDTVVLFDNVDEGRKVDSPVLAQLLTSNTWSDRILGGSTSLAIVNDKQWLATGNNISIGGDMASRTVLVRIDPQMEDPGSRDTKGFAIGDITEWVKEGENLARLQWCMLTMVRSWVVAGMPEVHYPMRSFTRWASVMGGFLEHHGVGGFMGNVDDLKENDVDVDIWVQFYERWHEMFGDVEKSANDLMQSTVPGYDKWHNVDPWLGTFPTMPDGRPFTVRLLGSRLKAKKDRIIGGWALRFRRGNKNIGYWRPERVGGSVDK